MSNEQLSILTQIYDHCLKNETVPFAFLVTDKTGSKHGFVPFAETITSESVLEVMEGILKNAKEREPDDVLQLKVFPKENPFQSQN